MSNEETILSLVKQIAALAIAHRSFFKLEAKPVFKPGAGEQDIEKLKKHWRHPLPDDYLNLLRAHDGIDNFDAPNVFLLSTKHILDNPEMDELFVDAEIFKEGEIFIFCQADTDVHSVAFRAGRKGNIDVIDFDSNGIRQKHTDFLAYLQSRKAELEKDIARHKADREGLTR